MNRIAAELAPGGTNAPPAACFVWVAGAKARRNAFGLFERTFHLAVVPPSCVLHLFADTRYRLRVNGVFAATGPARFVTSHPEFDSHDLSPLLRSGTNTVSVEVNFQGASSFQAMPDGRRGFIAWGGGGGVSFETPGDWLAAELVAWRPDSPLFSFAQGPVEICDTRLPDIRPRLQPVVLESASAPWGVLSPYSGRPIPLGSVRPARLELAAGLGQRERIFGIMAHDPGLHAPSSRERRPKSTAFATWILSPRAQVVRMSCFWSRLTLNGAAVEVGTDTIRGNHATCELPLREGWNLLCGTFEILTEYWAYCLGVPHEAGVTLHARADAGCPLPLAVSPAAPSGEVALPAPTAEVPPPDWTAQDGAPPNLTPARVVAWDEIEAEVCRQVPAAQLPEMSPIVAEAATWCFRFDGEFHGHPSVEVEAPAGAVLDVACDDWQDARGTLALYRSNPFIESADRFILRGGRQRVDLFHPRGGKFLQITLRAPAGPAPLSLLDVFVRSRSAAGPVRAALACGHPALDWTWPRARRTLAASTTSAYSDCPWRERGAYIADTLVSLHLDAVFHGHLRAARRTLLLFARAQREDGHLPCCAPAWLRRTYGDFTLLWLLALRDYWALSGDLSAVRESWDNVGRIWTSSAWDRHESGLWNGDAPELFIDWGALPAERGGPGNAALNILRCGAASACAELAAAMGDAGARATFTREAAAVEDAVFRNLWLDSHGRLAPHLGSREPALHANVLALFFGVGSPARQRSILAGIEPALCENFSRGIQQGQMSGYLELYFFHFLLPALAAHGRPDLAEDLIARHYGFLESLGDDTLPECFSRVQRGVGSRCHPWSGAAAVHAAREVLGVRPAEPGNPGRMLFQPRVHGIGRASGCVAHPAGWIEVRWERKPDGSFDARCEGPPGVEIIALANTVPPPA